MTELVENMKKLELTSSPHIHSKWNTKTSMWMVVMSLVPAVIAGVIYFGIYQLVVIAVSMVFAALTEFVIKRIRNQKVSITDGSGLLTGLLLGLIVPPGFNLAFVALGAIVAIGIGKEIFGGLGYNIFNPALVGRAFLQAAFPVPMTTWSKTAFATDATTSATPLASAKFDKVFTGLQHLVTGNIGGSIGETSAIAILIGGAFLIGTRIVNWRIPLSMTLGVLIFGGIFWMIDPVQYPNPLFHIFAGGFLFGAIFMATDWVTSPITNKGMWIYGFSISLVLVLIRLFGGLPEGMMYSILFMNAFVPLINRYTRPRLFGEVK